MIKMSKDILEKIVKDGGLVPSEAIGRLGEQYSEVVFKKMKIQKNDEKDNQSNPDFNIIINCKKFQMENKVLDEIYQDFSVHLKGICEELKKEDLMEKFDFELNPLDVHTTDRDKIYSQIKKILESDSLEGIYLLEGNTFNHTMKIAEKKSYIKGLSGLIHGYRGKLDSNLKNQIGSSKEQIKVSDLLCLIVLNEEITENQIINYFYPLIGIYPCSVEETGEPFSQIKYDFWSEYKKLKVVLAIYPVKKEVLLIPSPIHFSEFSAPEYYILRKILKEQGFRVKILSKLVELVE